MALGRLSRLAVLPLLLSLQACFGLGGRSEPAQYQLLTARAEQNAAAPLAGKSIGIGPVHVAQFLQRPQVVTHGGSSQLRVETNLRWGEPLEQGIQRVLVQNLAALTGAETRNFPWRQNMIPDYALRIDVIDLDKLPNGDSILEVNWVLEDLTTARVMKTQQERISSNSSYDDLLAQLAQHAADVLLRKD
ncbi:MAG TPA: PqiC family protein [Spongiibacteraceae bacterium]|nr:PqiC family protein [Spongiibacteraceae bacterium]